MENVLVHVRQVEPEWLDSLPADAGEATKSRRDLNRLNAWMLQSSIMARLLQRATCRMRPRTLIDLGAGDGTFMLKVARRLAPAWGRVEVMLVDRNAVVGQETLRGFDAVSWRARAVSADVFSFLHQASPGSADVIVANLFLHHLDRQSLTLLLDLLAPVAPCFVACEPRRSVLALAASRSIGLIGCNAVTRHDAPASVRAGFRDSELSALWPAPGWRLQEYEAGLFTHGFAAHLEDPCSYAPL